MWSEHVELKRQKRFERLAKQSRILDDVPVSIRKHLRTHEPGEPRGGGSANVTNATSSNFFTKRIGSPEALEKALEKEIPWHMISAEEKDLFRAAEQKQWDEHLQYGAVRPLSLEESARVEVEVGKERILPSRFLYRDKNLAKRRSDPNVECKAKARLCVGGQRDPDLGTTEMAVDAPTANRHSILLCLLLALSWSWRVSIGDIRAAFLNGVEAPRKLYFKQPVRGLPGLMPGQLVEIVKGVFGLSTSPKLWWVKLSTELLQIKIPYGKEEVYVEQNEIDPCVFLLKGHGGRVVGAILTHVDDLMIMTEPALHQELQAEISKRFPVDDWETDAFEYVGCQYEIGPEEIKISQENYAQSRLEKVRIPGGLTDNDPAPEDMIQQNRTTVGCLSWLAKQTRPDIQFMVAQAQRLQANPTVGDVKNTNKIVDMAKRFKDEGIKLKKIDVNDMIILAFHDAAWANVDLEEEIDPVWDGDTKLSSQLACLVMVADRKVLENKEGNASFVDWRSRASSRVCRSTFAGETMACGEAMEAALYLRCLLLSFQQGRLVPEAEAGEFQEMHLCTDCKSLYDHLHREGVPKAPTERRLAIDLAAIRQSLKTEAIHQWKRRYGIGAVRPDKPCKPPLHWVPTEEQLADVLTKKMNPARGAQ